MVQTDWWKLSESEWTAYTPPSAFYDNVKNLPPDATFYLYYGLAASTRAKNLSAVKQYQQFCKEKPYSPVFPISQLALAHFIAHEALKRQASYVTQIIASLKSHQIDSSSRQTVDRVERKRIMDVRVG
jgi:hypothetical protein